MNKKEIWQEEREAEKGLGDLFASLQLTPTKKKHHLIRRKRTNKDKDAQLNKNAKSVIKEINQLFQ